MLIVSGGQDVSKIKKSRQEVERKTGYLAHTWTAFVSGGNPDNDYDFPLFTHKKKQTRLGDVPVVGCCRLGGKPL